MWPLLCDEVFSGRKVPWNFRRGSVRTDNTNIRHDCQLIPHFANVSADKFELASAPSYGMPIGGRSLCCTLPRERERDYIRHTGIHVRVHAGHTKTTEPPRTRNFISELWTFAIKRSTNCTRNDGISKGYAKDFTTNLTATISDFIFKIINITMYTKFRTIREYRFRENHFRTQ